MVSWTGLEGEEDKIMRKEGKTFILANSFEKGIRKISESQIKDGEWDDWCNVCARTLEDAIKIYDKAFDQWQDSENKIYKR